MSRLEILAPVGGEESLTAAVRAGADAVYLGASRFNARRHAQNFTDEQLADAIAYCHIRGVKVHITLNTLVREDEMADALSVARTVAALGADALIVQDRGLAARIRAAAPDLPLHASTQLSCHTPAGVDALRDAGFSRVVLAREMSEAQIAACAGRGVELEMFVHGALCMSVSGQCYLSAMLGGRSGNRGLCAQPCRLPFAPSEEGVPDGRYAMSLKDLSLAGRFDRLAALGVCSLKIEGRMKRPEYVAAACRVYAALRDGETPDAEELARLQAVFSRSGFTDGYVAGRLGAEMFGHRRHEDVTAAEPVLRQLTKLYDKETPRVAITAALSVGDTLTLRVSDGEHTVSAARAADDRPPLDAERVRSSLQKTGGTPFAVTEITAEACRASVSSLNALRREALDKLTAARAAVQATPFADLPAPVYPARAPSVPKLYARLANAAQLTDAVRTAADGWFLPLAEVCRVADPWGVEIPRGLFGQEDATRRLLAKARAAGAKYALCGNVGALPLAKEAGLIPIGGFGLNITNSDTLAAYAAEGLAAATLSMELTFRQMAFADHAPIPSGILLYGRQPLMLTRNCPRRAADEHACAHCTPDAGLCDRKGAIFPTACNGGCTEILNSVPLWWADRLGEVPRREFYLLHFTTEEAKDVEKILRAYRKGGAAEDEITRGLYRRGVE